MDFKKLLLDAGRALCEEEVKALAFLCTDLLCRNPTSVVSANDLFSRLADQDLLSAERPHLLTELLLVIQRNRLIRELKLPGQESITRSLISPYRKLLYSLSEEITVKDLNDVKFLLDKDLARKTLEENSTLEVFLEMEHKDLISDTNLTLLETIIASIRPTFQEKINHFKALQAREGNRLRPESDPSQAAQSLRPQTAASYEEMEEFSSWAQPSMNPSNTSMDLPNAFDGVERKALPHGPSGSNTETSSCAPLKCPLGIDTLDISQENKASSEEQPSQTTHTKTEVLGTYPMIAPKRGVCLIVNNYDFSKSIQGLQNREGTVFDEVGLKRVFEWLGFNVEIKNDCKREDMLYLMWELGRRNHSQVDCLACCFLSHGNEGCVYGVDGRTVQIKELKEPVDGSRCASLAKKPKLFFIQACQGTKEQKAVPISADSPAHDPADSPVSSDAIKAESIPSDADFLLGMATVPFHVSFRERKNGTWFIQSLCQNLIQMVPSGCDLVSIMTKVNADVSQKTDTTGVKKQMPQPAFSLRKRVVFPIPKAPPPSLSQ